MRIKIISLNVWIGGILLNEILDFLRQEDPDILLLQEVFNGTDPSLSPQYRTFEEFKKHLSFPYGLFAPAFAEEVPEFGNCEVEQGNAILSKFPLKSVSVIFYDVPFEKRINEYAFFHLTPRNLQHVVAEVGGKSLHLLNTQGIWGEHGNDTPRRIAMSDTILKEMSNHAPLILAGDMNVEPHTQSILKIEEKGVNVFKNDLKTSFNIKRKDMVKSPGYAKSVVDMIFVSPDIRIQKKYVPQTDISDHLPLVCEVEV